VAYDRATRALVRGWKERGLRLVGPIAADLVVELVERPKVGAVTWVPPVRDRTLLRGHSTAGQLANELARRWQLEPADLLARTRFAPAQRGQDVGGRRKNVSGAFRATRRVPPRICLVDDVYTTGATVSAAASALRKAGAREVVVVTFARTLRRLD
jgi:predicted amidophosphoribosyltransferase